MKLERLSRANDISFSDLSVLLPKILELLPNDKTDVEVQGAELKSLWNFDFREQGSIKVGENKLEIKPAQITVYGQEFSNLYRFGTFVYAISENIAGLTHFGGLLFAQMNPNRPFERRLDVTATLLAKRAENAAMVWADMLLDIGGFQYMKACFEYASKKANDALPVLLVLGEQHADGRDENLEPYVCRNFAVLRNKEGNIHQYDFDETAKNNGLMQGVNIFHVNIAAFENQYIDSPDIEKLYEIYSLSMGSKRPLMIHCTDGMDRAGGIAFAFHLLHNWRRIFNVRDPNEIAKNIMDEHALMQQLRGPSFCTAYDRRLHGAVQLAMLMRSVQICTEIYLKDQKLNEQFKSKPYLQQLYALQQKKEISGFFSPNESELLAVLQVRVKLECHYFEEFAEGLQHPQVSMWQYDQLLPATGSDRDLFQWIKDDFIKNCTMQEVLNLQLDKNYRMLLIKNKLSTATDARRDEINHRLMFITESSDTAMVKLKKFIAITLEVDAVNLIQSIEKLQLDSAESEELKGIKQFLARNAQSFESTKKMKATIRRLTAINDKLATKQNESASGLEHFYSRLGKISPRLSARFSNRESSSDESSAPKPITRGRSNSLTSRGSVTSVVANEAPDDTRGKSDAVATQDLLRARSKTELPPKANLPMPMKVKAESLSRSSGSMTMLSFKKRSAKNKDTHTDDEVATEKEHRLDYSNPK